MASSDPQGYGIAIDMVNDLPPRFSMTATGQRNLANRIGRRLITPRGALGYAPDYGFDTRGLLNDSATAARIQQLQSEVARECEKDEEVQAASATLAFTAATSTLTITVQLTTRVGPFQFVLAVTALTANVIGDF